MTTSTEIDRLTVRSPDGVDLAVWVDGQGPPLVLVHGSIQDHTISAALVAELKTDFTTYAMDRRGFGASGDGPSYSLVREFADVASVVDQVAARTGEPVVLWGHSFGASCAMGAAVFIDNVSRLVLYEPSLGLPYPTGWRRAEPEWASRVATAPTVAREARAEQEWTYVGSRMDHITVLTLLLSGTASPPDIKRATDAARSAIPGARVRTMPGHAHIAHRTDPAMVAEIVSEFVRE